MKLLAGLAVPAALALLAASPAPDPRAAALAEHIAKRAAELEAAGEQPDLDALLAPLVTVDREDLEDPEILEWAAELNPLGAQDYWTVQAAEVTPGLWMGYMLQGTMHCQTDWFFTSGSGGAPSLIETPPSYGLLCWNGTRRPGTADGRPALVQTVGQERPVYGATITVTPYDEARGWQRPYQVTYRLNDSFALAEQFCAEPASCARYADLAVPIAQHVTRPDSSDSALGDRLQPGETVFGEERTRWRELFADIPTFGEEAETGFPTFSTAKAYALETGGETLFVQAGIGGVGWREIGDILIVIARDDGDALTPLASCVVVREPTSFRSVEVTQPEICDDETC